MTAGKNPNGQKQLLAVISQLGDVAGNHARSLYNMAPASVVIRLTSRLAPGYDSYGFRITEADAHTYPEIEEALLKGDLPGSEFLLGGKIIRDMNDTTRLGLEKTGATLERSSEKTLALAGERAFR